MARWVPCLREWLNSQRMRAYKTSYTSWQSQNEFISLIGDAVRTNVCQSVNRSEIYSIMADTTPDLSHKDQLSLVIRFVDDMFEVFERLIKISEIQDKTGDGFADKVLGLIGNLGLSNEGLRFQCYDTTSSMSGQYKGAQAKISEKVDRPIPYVPCLGHKSNLCVEHSCEASILIDNFFATLQELYNYLTKSTTRFGKFMENLDKISDALMVKNLSKTRWTARAESVRAVWVSYDSLIETLSSLMEWDKLDRDARRTAHDIHHKMLSMDFFVSLLFMKNVMSKTKLAVTEVQKETFDIISGVNVMRQTADVMMRMRNDDDTMPSPSSEVH